MPATAAIAASLALQHGCELAVLRKALLHDGKGRASSSPSNIAEIVTNNLNGGVGDSLFPHSADVSQTFRYVDS